MSPAAPLVQATPELLEAAGHIAKIFIDGGSGAWSTMTGADLAYHPGDARVDFPEALAAQLGTGLVTRIGWSGDRSGKIYLWLSEDGAKAIIAYMMALMMGGEADLAGTQLDAEGMDAYAEAANNFVGQGAQALRGELGGELKFTVESTFRAELPGGASEAFGNAPLAALFGDFSLGGAGAYPLAVAMEPSCTGVAVPEAEGDNDAAAGASAEVLRDFSPENVAHVMKLPIPLVVVLAEKKMRMELVQEMAPGTIIEFRKQSGEKLDVCANNVKIAEAEVVMTNRHFGVQFQRMINPREKTENA